MMKKWSKLLLSHAYLFVNIKAPQSFKDNKPSVNCKTCAQNWAGDWCESVCACGCIDQTHQQVGSQANPHIIGKCHRKIKLMTLGRLGRRLVTVLRVLLLYGNGNGFINTHTHAHTWTAQCNYLSAKCAHCT